MGQDSGLMFLAGMVVATIFWIGFMYMIQNDYCSSYNNLVKDSDSSWCESKGFVDNDYRLCVGTCKDIPSNHWCYKIENDTMIKRYFEIEPQTKNRYFLEE